MKSADSAPQSLEQVTFHPHSFCDPGGRLFMWEGELYRGITRSYLPVLRRLLDEGIVERLVRQGLLIETEPVSWLIDGFELVVRHRRIPFPSYPTEWCPAMLKAAALATLDLAIELAAHGMTLRDAHPWNLLIDRARPVYVDLTSIVPIHQQSGWLAEDEFNRFSRYPLHLMVNGYDAIARRMLATDGGVEEDYVDKLVAGHPLGIKTLYRRLFRACRSRVSGALRGSRPVSDRLRMWREEISQLPCESDQGESADVATNGAVPSEFDLVTQVLNGLRPQSILLEGRGHAWLARVQAEAGRQVVTFSADPTEVNRLFADSLAGRFSVLPLVMDLSKPTPSIGVADHWLISASDRLKCEAVVALDLLPRMVYQRRLDLRKTVECVAQFASRWLIFEWTERTGSERTLEAQVSLSEVVADLRLLFSDVRMVRPASGSPTLLVCEQLL